MIPHYDAGGIQLYAGDVRATLAALPEKSVHTVVTSPPYYGLRSYQTEPQVWGGDPDCAHDWNGARGPRIGRAASAIAEGLANGIEKGQGEIPANRYADASTCARCGAWRGEFGQEPTVDLYVSHLVEMWRGIWRVMRDDATCWINLGDSYAGGGRGGHSNGLNGSPPQGAGNVYPRSTTPDGMKPKDLMLVPFSVALALRADGWYVRQTVIWAKKAPMPESVTDRPTTAHEYVFLLSKRPTYYYDAEAVKEQSDPKQVAHNIKYAKPYAAYDDRAADTGQPGNVNNVGIHARGGNPDGSRNMRSVWHLGPSPFPAAHFATFPPEIPRRAILAGTSARGCCAECGAPWTRVVERTPSTARPNGNGWQEGRELAQHHGPSRPGSFVDGESRTVGWQPGCTHQADVVPATILDPFSGSGTTAMVAQQLGRHAIGIDLKGEYHAMAIKRLGQPSLLAGLGV